MAKMHRKLFNWFQDKRAKLGGKKGKARQAQDGPKPLVPPWTCRSPLSPTPSRTDLIASASAATADSAFFQYLPSEIRREILVMAFGNRTMHMSLEFNHPRRLSDLDVSRWGKYLPPTVRYPPQRLGLDKQAPMAWQWCGCLCWRIGHPNHPNNPHSDLCLPGVARCWEHASDVPDTCLIGAMGWLLSCRLAYLEGIEVLYSTNRFHLSNRNSVVLHHIQSLLPPRRLAMITSLELDFDLFDVMGLAERDRQNIRCPHDAGRPGFLALLEAIPKAFPNLRAAHMDIHGLLFPFLQLAERPPFYDQYIFEPVDDMVRKLGPQLEEFILAVPYTLSAKSMSRALSEGWKIKHTGWEPNFRWDGTFQRRLSALDINGQAQHSPEETTVRISGERGYWVTQGFFDDPFPQSGCFCTGSSDPELHAAIRAELDSWTDKDKPRPGSA